MSGEAVGPAATIPLSSLRPAFAGGWPLGSRWLPIPGDGGRGSVEHPTGTALVFRVDHLSPGRLRGRVSIVNAGPRKPVGVVRARAVLRGEGWRKEIWTGFIGNAGRRPAHGSLEFDAELVAGATELQLLASRLRPADPGVTRVRWEGPALEFPGGPSPAAVMPQETAADWDPTPSSGTPLFSILTPVHNPASQILEEMLDSVRGQSFGDWELRLVDDGSTDPEVTRILERVASEDDRIHLVRRDRAGGISAATNTALDGATGEYVALLDHDDVLAEDALASVAAVIAESPDVDMIYSDEDVIDEGRRIALFRKPSWSPDLMRSHMYTCHFGVYRRRLATAVEGFRSEFDGAQDYDLALRISERTDRIVHIPRVLYHWRSHAGSVAENLAAKPHAYAAGRRAIAEHLERTEVDAEVHFDALRSWYRVDYPADPRTRAGLVLPLPAADEELVSGLRRAGASWARTSAPAWELVLAGPAPTVNRCHEALKEILPPERLRIVPTEAGLGRSALINRAASASSAARLVLLEAPVEPLTSNWLTRLVTQAGRPEIAAVGAKVLARDGRVEHAGLVLRDGLPIPILLAADQIEPGPMAVLQVTGNFAALSGAVAIDRGDFDRLDGLDERMDTLGVADFCLRAWQQGSRILSCPDVVLRRTEERPPVNDIGELLAFRAKWLPELPQDPYFDSPVTTALTGLGEAA